MVIDQDDWVEGFSIMIDWDEVLAVLLEEVEMRNYYMREAYYF